MGKYDRLDKVEALDSLLAGRVSTLLRWKWPLTVCPTGDVRAQSLATGILASIAQPNNLPMHNRLAILALSVCVYRMGKGLAVGSSADSTSSEDSCTGTYIVI